MLHTTDFNRIYNKGYNGQDHKAIPVAKIPPIPTFAPQMTNFTFFPVPFVPTDTTSFPYVQRGTRNSILCNSAASGSYVASANSVIISLSCLSNSSPKSLFIVSKSSLNCKEIMKTFEGFFLFRDCFTNILSIVDVSTKMHFMRLGSRWQTTVHWYLRSRHIKNI
jgi:hypothetical protein